MSTSDVDSVWERLEGCKLDAEKKIRDEELFKQPPSLFGDYPICFLRIPNLNTGWKYQTCCGKIICSGCCCAPVYDNQGNLVKKVCPFCRVPNPNTDEEIVERGRILMEKGNAIEIYNKGNYYFKGKGRHRQDRKKVLELVYRAGEIGHATA